MSAVLNEQAIELHAQEAQKHPAPAVQQRAVVATPTPADLLRIAVEGGADLDRLERLMDLQARWEAAEAKKAFVQAMTRFKAEPLEIFKRKSVSFETRNNGQTSYKHAELSDVTDAVGPAMAKHGLSYRWDVQQEKDKVTVDCIVTHELGHSERVTMFAPPDGSGNKNQIQQIASTVTYLQRYTLLSATGMATKGMDDDGRGSAPAQDQCPPDLLQAARDAACNGTAAYAKFFSEIGLLSRKRLLSHHKTLKAVAMKADESIQARDSE